MLPSITEKFNDMENAIKTTVIDFKKIFTNKLGNFIFIAFVTLFAFSCYLLNFSIFFTNICGIFLLLWINIFFKLLYIMLDKLQ